MGEIEHAKLVYEDLNTEAYLIRTTHETMQVAEQPECPHGVAKQLQNLAAQIRKMMGPTELYHSAMKAAQKFGRKTLAGESATALIGSVFSDLSTFEGLKPWVVEDKDTALSH